MTHVDMRGFLLLVFSVVTGITVQPVFGEADRSKVEDRVSGCRGGWVNFTCKNPEHLNFSTNKMKTFKDKNSNFTVIRNIEQDDNVQLCSRHGRKLKLRIDDCEDQIEQTAYVKASTTIPCGKPKMSKKSLYLCKETGDFMCDNVLSMNTNGKYIEKLNNTGLNLTIKMISSEDRGVYWCTTEGYDFFAAFRKVYLNVRSDVTLFKERAVIQDDFHFSCNHSKKQSNYKYICKGEDPQTCRLLVSSEQSNLSPGKFTLNETGKKRICLTINNVTAEDAGMYWVGTKSDATKQEEHFLCRLILTVVTHFSTQTEIEDQGGSKVIMALSVCVVLLVLLVVVLVFINKCNRRDGAPAQNDKKEDYVYEEIQMPAPGKTVSTVYATADFSQDSVHYTTVSFPKREQAAAPKPSSSQCEYASVFSKSQDKCTIYSPPARDPLYSNINK